jgi:hypothetical protein
MSVPGGRSLAGSVSKLSGGVQTDGTYKARLSLLSPVLGETDAPAPVRAKEWARGRGGLLPASGAVWRLKPLTLVLSLGQGDRRNKHHGTHNRRTPAYCPKVL